MINIGVIGCGYWGPNLVRNLSQNRNVKIHTLCDISEDKLKNMQRFFPQANFTKDAKDIFDSQEIDAVVIAVGVRLHYDMAKQVLLSGKHCLVEKPLALSYSEAVELTELAQKKKLVLMVSHTFLYNAAVRKLKEYIKSQELGKVLYTYASRLNLGIIRRDVNALWNFAPHDVSIICYLLDDAPVSVSAKGLKYIHDDLEDVVFMDLDFKNNVSSHIHISWIDPKKVRETVVVGTKKMVIYDDTSSDAKLKIFEKGFDKIDGSGSVPGYINYGEFQLQLRDGDCLIPKLDFQEPLKVECDHFIDCIMNNKVPLTDGKNGAMVVRILELAQASLEKGGIAIKV